jgi:uncharacterized membrane protein
LHTTSLGMVWVPKWWERAAAGVRLVRESDQVMGDTDVSRASLYGARPPKRQEKDVVVQFARWSLGVGQEFFKLTSVVVIVVTLYAPPILALIAGGMACVSCLFWLFQMRQAYGAGQYDLILSDLPALSSAAKIAFASLAYLALLYGFTVLISGMIGHRRQHFYVVPGIMLSFPALVVFTIAAYLLIRALASDTDWGTLPFVILFSYIGIDAAALGLLVTDLRPNGGARMARSVLPYNRAVALGHKRITTVDRPPIEHDGPAVKSPEMEAESHREFSRQH